MVKKDKRYEFSDLQDACRDKGIPYKDASSAEELRKRLAPKKAKPKK